MQSLEFTSNEAVEASNVVSRRSRRRFKSVPLLTLSALFASILLWFVVTWNEESSNVAELGPPDEVLQEEVELDADESMAVMKEEGDLSSLSPSTSGGDYDCQTDRLGHKHPIYVGQALCNAQYRFGLTSEGVFQWQDFISDETHVLYSGGEGKVDYFEITETGVLQLFSRDEDLVWEKESNRDIHATKECLHNPLLDCPYLHLHKSGDVVLNWIDDEGKWLARNIKRCYKDLFV
jgi:hypothetical protein